MDPFFPHPLDSNDASIRPQNKKKFLFASGEKDAMGDRCCRPKSKKAVLNFFVLHFWIRTIKVT